MQTEVRKLANGEFCAYLYERRGGPLVHKSYGRTRDEAVRRLAERSDDKSVIYGLVNSYLASREFKNLADTTQRDYKRYLKAFTEEFGSYAISLFEHPSIRIDLTEWREQYADTPRTADLMIRAVGALFKWGIARGYSNTQPTAKISMIHKADRSDIIWLQEDFDRMKAVAPVSVMNAVILAAQTGLRQGDLLRLQWSSVYEDHVQLVTRKRAQAAIVPLTSDALCVLQTLSRDTPTVLVNSKGASWTLDGFRASFQAARTKAGVNKRFHDLRGTAATYFRSVGFTNAEIALTMGWSVASVEQLMLKYVSGSDVIRSAIARVNSVQTAPVPMQNETTNADPNHLNTFA